MAADGVSAEMTPVFPTLTFPNHWTMLTGLYPAVHGIVANTFHRPGTGDFYYGEPEGVDWWGGEPAWSVAEQSGRKALSFMW
jgi:predicted AlkP superfamily pyrophosphatase or phosphodiesterase